MNKANLKPLTKAFLMNAYLELLRPYNGILAILGIVLGYIVAASFTASAAQLALAIIVAFLINGAGNVINDYFDHKIDEVNRPRRPIPSGRASRKGALAYFFTLIAVSLAISYFVSMQFLYLAALNSLVSFVYSWKLKGTPLIGNIAVSWLAASTFIGGAFIVFATIPLAVIILALTAFLATLSREIFKDAEDVEGDKKFGAKTLPIAIGAGKATGLASLVLLLAIAALFIPAYMGMFRIYYFIGIIPAILICLFAIRKMKKPHKAQKLVKMAMYFVFLGFVLGTFF